MNGWEFPPGFIEAELEYLHKPATWKLWYKLDIWRQAERGAKYVARIEDEILAAVYEGNLPYVRALLRAMEIKAAPKPDLNAIIAALQSFGELFSPATCDMSRAAWPTKLQVRQLAIEKLRLGKYRVPGKARWNDIFKLAGLWDLPEDPGGRPRKPVV